MAAKKLDSNRIISSFICRGIFKDNDLFLRDDAPAMCTFFGTKPADYDDGVIARIRKDISAKSADYLVRLFQENQEPNASWRVVYTSLKAGRIPCLMQMDAYAGEITPEGIYYDIIGMDVTKLMEAEKLSIENKALMDDSPVGLGIYHIKDKHFELVYTNNEYYRAHCGTKEFWDSFKGADAIERIFPEDRKLIYEEWQRILEHPTDKVFDAKYRILGQDEQIHWIELKARLAEEINGVRICYASYTNIDAEKAAEEKALAAHKDLLNALHNLPVAGALYVFNPVTRQLSPQSYTDGLCRLMQMTQEEIWQLYGGPDAFACVHPDDVEQVKKEVLLHCLNKDMGSLQYRLATPRGDYKWVKADFKVLEAGGQSYLYLSYTDIDDLKAHEALIEKSYADVQAGLEAMSGSYLAIYQINLTRNKLEKIQSPIAFVQQETALTYDDFLNHMLAYLPRQQDKERARQQGTRENLLQNYEAGNRNIVLEYYFRYNNHPGHWLQTSVALTKRLASGDIIGFMYARDITKEKTVNILMHHILIREYDFIASIDLTQNSLEIVSTNAQSAAVTEVHGGTGYDLILREYVDAHMAGENRKACLRFMQLANVKKTLDEKGYCGATFVVTEVGETRIKRMEYYYLDKEAQLIVMLRTDLTSEQQEQRAQEEKLRTALEAAKQASIAKTQFLSRMSHEIRTPMNAIIGLDTIALQERNLSESLQDNLSKIGISARFLLSLINDILDMSRIESGRMLLKSEEFNFCRLLDGVNTIFNTQCREKGLTYECVAKGIVEEYYIGDELKLQQVLVNMLGNSVKFTPKGGKVQLLVEQLHHTGDNVKIKFDIIDTGEGIEDEFLPHIFEAFSQENAGMTSTYGGSGLGLAICKNLVKLMDGDIEVHTVKGMGTTFTVTVNLKLPRKSRQLQSATIALSALKTLIVDDNVIDCQHAEIVLKQAGIAAEWVDSGAGAVELVTRRHAARDDFRLILVDWQMPDMDGIETARAIRKIVGPDVTILILTAYDWTEIEQKAKRAGIDNFMRKPIFVSSIIQAYDDTRLKHKQLIKHTDYDFTGKKVLVVEDNKINAEIAKKLLELKGLEVTLAGNGVEAIERFTNSRVGEYAAILMDVRMPYMDGLEATKTIRTIRKADSRTIPIIAMSANAFEEDVHKSMLSGMNAHLSKPLEANLIYETLEKFINKKI